MMSPNLHAGGQWWLEESNRSRGGLGGGHGEEGPLEGSEEALFYLAWILCFGPSACSLKTLVGSSSWRPPHSLHPILKLGTSPLALNIIWTRLKDMNFPSIETSL